MRDRAGLGALPSSDIRQITATSALNHQTNGDEMSKNKIDKFEWNGACHFTVDVETTGPQGGDGGHGGFTSVTFTDTGGTCMEAAPERGLMPMRCGGFTIRFAGDDEMRGFAKAIEFLDDTLCPKT
jgi:hypothetical protein